MQIYVKQYFLFNILDLAVFFKKSKANEYFQHILNQTIEDFVDFLILFVIFQNVKGTAGRLADIDDRLRRVEDSSRENKNALSQLISHTQVKSSEISLELPPPPAIIYLS